MHWGSGVAGALGLAHWLSLAAVHSVSRFMGLLED